ncbi:MAG: DUF2256 domain-containing protein [Chloracidobacterium sp.]|uniref:DUF2256 domain-containing protein n=1 Tax=Chloracidobacterium validum TaxID=2821543 RepID=A0ABX8BGS0_9BACT|nr:DUF2256 domain-containing protein [Chloracidobacterium validum]QUW04685.1 DUF2256 domain-containing protein [Chloracidobacterium validum]
MTHKKPHLPEKICPVCQRPFTWRKKWRNTWEKVVYCSKACAGRKRESSPRK